MRLVLAAVLGFALAGPVGAQSLAPLPAPHPIDWNGFYGGVIGGGAIARVGRDDLFASPVAPPGQRLSFAPPVDPAIAAGSTVANGLALGGVFGFQRQYSAVVFGLEADLMWLGVKGRASTTRDYVAASTTTCGYLPIVGPAPCPASATNLAVSERQDLAVSQSFLSTARARLGTTFGSTMIYITGGLALSAVSARLDSTTTIGTRSTTRVNTNLTPRAGYAVGLGAEHMLTGNIALRAEWLSYGLGAVSLTNPAVTLRSTVSGHLLRAGLLLRL